jgi:uncharacterized protein YdhG (YjbR/CyaY superfamily)
MRAPKANTVDEYLALFPPSTQERLTQLRAAIRKAAPRALESISYGMPAYKQGGVLVYFAGYARHIGFYPLPSAIRAFQKDIARYKSAKGSVQFPLDEPLPLTLVAKMVKFRVKENLSHV